MGGMRRSLGWAVLVWAVLWGMTSVSAAARERTGPPEPGGATRWYWFARGIEAEDPLRAVAHDRKGNIVAGGFFGGGLLTDSEGRRIEGTGDFTALVVKFSPTGRLLWYRTFDAVGMGPSGSTFAEVRALAVDRRGDILVAGVHSGTLDLGGGPLTEGHFLVKLDPEGRHVWSRAFPEDGSFEVGDMVVDRDGDILVIGQRIEAPSVLVKLSSEGEERWRLEDSMDRGPYTSLAVDDDENIYVGGGAVFFGKKPFIMKVSPRGEPRWARTLGATTGEVQGLTVSGDRVVLSGPFTGGFTFGGRTLSSGEGILGFVLAFNRRGQERWARTTGAGARHYVSSEECDDVVATGNYRAGDELGRGPEPGEPGEANIYAARFDRQDGAVHWVRTFPSEGSIPLDISVARDGSSAIVGVFIFPIDFGDGPIISEPVQDDPFLLNLAP